ncbi:MAG TPA: ATP-binding cassette domain-containing protein [Acidimicrobiales bacterium]|nr:ATP-binding cassette domain-containing protein [Acidimicrobiales bacterium]
MRLPRSAGPLSSAELAEAAVLGDLTVALLFLGWLLPLGPVIEVLSVAPMAALAYRRRLRAVVGAGLASSSVAFLLGGVNLWSICLLVTDLGFVIGLAMRHQWGVVRLLLCGLVVWALVAGVTVGQLLVFASFRKLAFDQIRNSWHGIRRILSTLFTWFPGIGWIERVGDHLVNWVIAHWWAIIPAGEVLLVEGVLLAAWAISRPTIRSLERSMGKPEFGPGTAGAGAGAGAGVPAMAGAVPPPGPVPVHFDDVSFRYPGADGYALSGVDLDVPEGAYVAVVGSNGSGKSTLARITAGMLTPEGSVTRPGAVGLGRPGGTAVVFQRPESQVLGVRVRDDVVWGMDPPHAASVDVAGVLARVGLAGMEEEETSTLSGGQLQRLAIASALARHPMLLVSDESTSMLDPAGRRQVAELLVSLAGEDGLTVLHVTHRAEEAAAATTVVRVETGTVTAS